MPAVVPVLELQQEQRVSEHRQIQMLEPGPRLVQAPPPPPPLVLLPLRACRIQMLELAPRLVLQQPRLVPPPLEQQPVSPQTKTPALEPQQSTH
jgi:hypothetical protein